MLKVIALRTFEVCFTMTGAVLIIFYLFFLLAFIFLLLSLEVQREDEEWKEYVTVVDSLAYTLKDLSPNGVYRFRVRAENIHGRSEPSQSSEDVTIEVQTRATNGCSTRTDGLSSEYSADDVDNDVAVRPGGDFRQRFIVEEELGKGRFGVVHKVTERETGQVLAAKIVKCIKAKDKIKVRQFGSITSTRRTFTYSYSTRYPFQIQEEILIMRTLRHPKLLQLAAAFENPREMIMVME